ncbi:MAG: trypsin-like peptidase domain-containing protein [Anaerolineae bacterium]|nr:S1C family serine protease [Candidatus Roseilinea sp.]MDW8451229.1 trypsin-like peptidase domain-containing protein [Anaerolineae bacterium]
MNERSTHERDDSPSGKRLMRLSALPDRLRTPMLFIAGVLATLVALILYNALTPDPPQLTQRDVNDAIVRAMASATPRPPFSVGAFQAVAPALVLIQTERPGQDSAGDGKQHQGLGSGVIVNDQGLILTSLHVVEDAEEIRLTFADGTEAYAWVIAEQPENDIAVLQPSQLPAVLAPAPLGNPNALRVGDEAFVVGNPLGLYGSLSAGVISGLKRSFTPPGRGRRMENLIQFDAAVNPGSSGGPLLNRYGQVVGIVTGLANPSGQEAFSGIGFAVPIDIAGGAAGMPSY